MKSNNKSAWVLFLLELIGVIATAIAIFLEHSKLKQPKSSKYFSHVSKHPNHLFLYFQLLLLFEQPLHLHNKNGLQYKILRMDEVMDFHQRVYSIYDFAEGVSGLFFYLYFSEHFGERVMKMSAKNSVDSVRMAMITEMPVMLPMCHEQQRIATCLTSLDDLITTQTQTLETLKTHKKGLMQQLFPSAEAVAA